MTADRRWVRVSARWLARIDGVSGQLRLAFLLMTGLSTMSVALQSYGLGDYALPAIAVSGVGTLVFAYLYTEGGVWNQVARDKKDLSHNFAEPKDLIGHRIGLEQLAVLGYVVAQNGDAPDDLDEIRAEMDERTVERWREYRDGVDLERGQEA